MSQPLAAQVNTLDIFAAIAGDLQQVEAALEDSLATQGDLLAEVSTYLLKSGGKRIRPALMVLTSKFPGSSLERVIPTAVAVELIHMATLVHDDVVDKASTRRGRPTVNTKWSNHVSVLTGDYLFAKAFSILAQTGHPRVVQVMADVVYEMSRGELAQSASCFQVDQTEEDYYQRIRQKTGYLLAESCRVGAVMGGATEEQIQALYNYGLGLGLSFQIADDLLDFHGSAEKVGKPVCGDLKAGLITLPMIHGLRYAARANDLREILCARNITDAEITVVKAILSESGSFDYARFMAQTHLDKAVAELNEVPNLATCSALQVLADFVINRQF